MAKFLIAWSLAEGYPPDSWQNIALKELRGKFFGINELRMAERCAPTAAIPGG